MPRLPVADAAAAISVLVVLLLIAAVLGIPLVLAGRRRRQGREALARGEATPEALQVREEQVEPNVAAIGVAFAAAGLAIVSVFLPALETSAFSHIEKNTLIQSGTGFLIVGLAVAVVGDAYRVYRNKSRSWGVALGGLLILAAAVYAGTGSRTELKSVVAIGGESATVHGSPAVGIYAAGAAGFLALCAGLALGTNRDPVTSTDAPVATKVCPDCAETVLAPARVCKHCGHHFPEMGEPTE